MNEGPSPATTPVEIELDSSACVLRIRWADGHQSVYDWEYLRWRCPCAYCAGEGGAPGLLAQTNFLLPEQTRMVDVQLVGRYAIQPEWQDGHSTGIYTFRMLRALCPCPHCTSAA
jgi:DUF971 family protein